MFFKFIPQTIKKSYHIIYRSSSLIKIPFQSVSTKKGINQNIYKDQNDTWVDRHAPKSIQPYMKLVRIDRPIGTYLVLFPTLWSAALAAEAGDTIFQKNFNYFSLFNEKIKHSVFTFSYLF